MKMIHEDDWERDIQFSDPKVFERKGVYAVEPDKELSLACERYHFSEYLEDDQSDTNSSVSAYSIITDKPTVCGLDDFMYAEQSGTIQRLGVSRRVADYNDWNDELDISPLKFKQFKHRMYDSHLAIDHAVDLPVSHNVYLCEPEKDNDDFSGLNFPQDMTLLPKKLNEKKKCMEVKSTVVQEKPRLASIQREKEDDDFCEGLNVKNFQLRKNNTPPVIVNKPQLQSRIPLLKTVRQEQRVPTSRLHRFTMGTMASKRREAETRVQSQKTNPRPKLAVMERRGANGLTLIARPKKNKDYSYSSQLDELDHLPTFKAKKMFVLPVNHPKGESKMDPDRPWRKNMLKASKVKLIKPNDQYIKKEFNGMKFDENSQSWKGNEKALLAFQEKISIRRPMLISNRQQTSKYTSVIVNNMIFDTEKLQWVSAFGPEAEHNELDCIEDLQETSKKKTKVEFILSVEVKREMMFDQERHQNWIEHWPM